MSLKLLLFGIAAAFDGLFLAAVITKARQIGEAQRWLTAHGKVLSSHSEARKVLKTSASGDVSETEIRNFAVVRYEFVTPEGPRRGERIGIGEDLGNFGVAEKLARYPVGAPVSVFYDPRDHTRCVLERDDVSMSSIRKAIVAGVAFAVASVVLLAISEGLVAQVRDRIRNPGQASAVIFLGLMASASLGFGAALRATAARTQSWPQVRGRVASSELSRLQSHMFQTGYSQSGVRHVFRARTTYTYSVGGVAYSSDRLSFGPVLYASLRALARREAQRFRPGQMVTVWYDPSNPATAVIQQGAPGLGLIWFVSAVLALLTARIAGFF